MNRMPIFVDTKNIIVNLLKEDKKEYLSIERLQNLLNYTYIELWKLKKLNDYQITFEIDSDAIKRTVLYNKEIFALDASEKTIYLCNFGDINNFADNFSVDSTLLGIIKKFSVA